MKRWECLIAGETYLNKSGTTARKVTTTKGPNDETVAWVKVFGQGPQQGVSKVETWQRWCHKVWQEPRPDPFPVPKWDVRDVLSRTPRFLPPEHWVPEEFKDPQNPWYKALQVFVGSSTHGGLNAKAKKGVSAEDAMQIIHCCLYHRRHQEERVMSACAWMFSEWFEDFWFGEATTTTIHKKRVLWGPDADPSNT